MHMMKSHEALCSNFFSSLLKENSFRWIGQVSLSIAVRRTSYVVCVSSLFMSEYLSQILWYYNSGGGDIRRTYLKESTPSWKPFHSYPFIAESGNLDCVWIFRKNPIHFFNPTSHLSDILLLSPPICINVMSTTSNIHLLNHRYLGWKQADLISQNQWCYDATYLQNKGISIFSLITTIELSFASLWNISRTEPIF